MRTFHPVAIAVIPILFHTSLATGRMECTGMPPNEHCVVIYEPEPSHHDFSGPSRWIEEQTRHNEEQRGQEQNQRDHERMAEQARRDQERMAEQMRRDQERMTEQMRRDQENLTEQMRRDQAQLTQQMTRDQEGMAEHMRQNSAPEEPNASYPPDEGANESYPPEGKDTWSITSRTLEIGEAGWVPYGLGPGELVCTEYCEEAFGRAGIEIDNNVRRKIHIRDVTKDELEDLVRNNDPRTKGVVTALTQSGQGTEISVEQAAPGDFVQYWGKTRKGVLFGHSAQVLGWTDSGKLILQGSHLSKKGIGTITLNPSRPSRLYVVRPHYRDGPFH